MDNLADTGFVCECGKRLAPRGQIKVGDPLICARCARCFQMRIAEVRWSTAVLALQDDPHELQAFEWTRRGVPLEQRRTLAELAESAPSRAAEKSAAVLLLVLLLVLVLVAAKGLVHS